MSSPGVNTGPGRRIWVAAFAGITVALLGGSAWVFLKATDAIRQKQFSSLAAIGTLKSGQIQQWRTERLADARRLARGPLVTRAIAEFLREPDRQDRRAELRQRLQPERMVDVYDSVHLLAPDGRVLLTTEDPPRPVDPATQRARAAALVGQEAVLSDFFRAGPDGSVRIDAVSAVRDEAGRPVAAVVLRSNADAFLYPLIQSWPTPSPSGETLLVQRDGENVVFLNDLRHRSRTALSLRVPISRTTNAGVQAALGRHGAFEGRDYRDVNVLADLRPIPGSPWFMVAKVDTDEILADARSRARLITLLAASFILLAAASTAHLYAQRQAGIFRDLYEAERRQRESQEASRAILNSIGDAVITTDVEGLVRGMNPAAARLTGWTEEEGRGQPLETIFRVIDEATRATTESPVHAVLRDSGIVRLSADTLLITREGIERRIVESAAAIRDERGAVSGVVLVFSDQTVAHAARQALKESEDRYRDLVENSQALICTHDLEGRLLSVNEVASRISGYSVEALLRMNVSDLLVPHARPLFGAYLAEIQTIGHARGVLRIQTASGEIRLWEYQTTLRTEGVAVPVVRGMAQDITERRLAERALQESLERFQLASRATFDVIWDFDNRTNTIWFNDKFETVFGYTADDAKGSLESWPSRVHPDDLERVRAGIHAAYQSKGEFWSDEYRYRRKDGSYAVVENRGVIARDAAGLPVRSIGAMQDITERRHAEEALHVQARILDNIGQAVIATDPSGIIAYANRFAEELYGWSPAELLGRNVLDVTIPAASREQAEQIMARVRQGESWSGEALVRCRDGIVFPALVTNSPLLDKKGTLIGIIGISSDIAERKRAEAEQRVQSAALNAAVFPVVITDRDGTIEWVNPAFTTLTGYTAEEAIGRNPREIAKSGVHDRAFYKILWDTILAGNVWRSEITNRRKDGSRYVEDLVITPVKNAGGEITHFIAIKRDLTKDKVLQAQFLQVQKMETVGRLAGGIAHDFNNLLTVINGTAELAAANLMAGDPLLADLQEIHVAGGRAAALTRQLLAFSRKQIMQPDVVNLGVLAANLRNMLQRLIGEHINLVVAAAKDVGNVLADPGQMEQVIVNLVVNARDAMPTGGTLTVETRDVELDAAFAAGHPSVRPGPHVMVTVSDTGTGMDEATRLRVFEPFFTTKEAGQGTGLGLATVYGIVKQSDGSIWVSSAVGEGTTFRIYLPRVNLVVQTSQPPRAPATLSGTETILVVEDESVLRHLATRILQAAGYTVLAAGDGGEALRLLEGHDGSVHLLLTDVVLPGMNGRDLATRVAKVRPETRILYTSGYTDDAVLRDGVLDSATNFVSKPYSRTELTRKVREVLNAPAGDRPPE